MKISKITRILLYASSLWYFGEGLFGPLFAVFAEKVGGDLLDITWAWSIYLIVAGLMYVVFGKLLNNSKYKEQAMVLGYGLNTVFTFCYLLVHSTTGLFLIQIGIGLAEAISTPIWDSMFASSIEDKEDTFHWGLANGHTHFVSGIAIAIGGLIAYYVSFNALFILMGSIQALATMMQARILYLKKKAVITES